MSNDPNVRVNSTDQYGHGAPGKNVQFPGQLGVAPKAHIPGQPVTRVVDMTTGGTTLLATSNVARITVQFKQLNPDASLPRLGSGVAAGYDLAAPEAVTFAPGERKTIPLGFALAIPEAYHARIESRSGLALKGLVVLTGVVDADYRGEVMVIMQNFSDKTHEFAKGDRVAQLVLRPTVHVPFETVEELTETNRGTGGFGSTGA